MIWICENNAAHNLVQLKIIMSGCNQIETRPRRRKYRTNSTWRDKLERLNGFNLKYNIIS